MKKSLRLILAATFLAAFLTVTPAGLARAEKIDFSKVTCSQFLDFDGDDAAAFYIWIDGYVSAKTGNTVLDTGTIESDLEGLINICRNNPNKTILGMINQ